MLKNSNFSSKNVDIKVADIRELSSLIFLNQELFENEYLSIYPEFLSKRWLFNLNSKQYFSNMINNNYVFVAKLNNDVIGYLSGYIGNKNDTECNNIASIDNLYIQDSYRNLGIATKLINMFRDVCTNKKNISNIRIESNFNNQYLGEFYIKNGFIKNEDQQFIKKV